MESPDLEMTAQNEQPQPPPWAYLLKDTVYVPGSDLHGGDTIYLSNRAYPRILWTKLSRTSWSVLVQQHSIHKRDQIAIEPDQFYVVKRATKR